MKIFIVIICLLFTVSTAAGYTILLCSPLVTGVAITASQTDDEPGPPHSAAGNVTGTLHCVLGTFYNPCTVSCVSEFQRWDNFKGWVGWSGKVCHDSTAACNTNLPLNFVDQWDDFVAGRYRFKATLYYGDCDNYVTPIGTYVRTFQVNDF